MLKLFGNTDVTRVTTTVGPEQEYFLIDKEMYEKRQDLILYRPHAVRRKAAKGAGTGGSLFRCRSSPRVAAFMEDLDEELWKLGIYAKTEHNEVAPCSA